MLTFSNDIVVFAESYESYWLVLTNQSVNQPKMQSMTDWKDDKELRLSIKFVEPSYNWAKEWFDDLLIRLIITFPSSGSRMKETIIVSIASAAFVL